MIDAQPHLNGDLEEVAGHRMLEVIEAKLKSMELPFAESTALETTRQRCSTPRRYLQLTSMYSACRHPARIEIASGLVGAVATFFQSS